MANIIKRIIRYFDGIDWTEYYPKTSADQVVFTKKDGTTTNLQDELSIISDNIIERGNMDDWTWTKYDSGLLEIEYKKTGDFYVGTLYGNMYHGNAHVTIPDEVPALKGTLEYATIEFIEGNGLVSGRVHSVNKDTNTIGFYVWNPTAFQSIRNTALFKFKARWK